MSRVWFYFDHATECAKNWFDFHRLLPSLFHEIEDAKKLLTKSEDGEKIFIDDSQIWEDGQGNKFVGGNETTTVAIPFVLKYLDSELSAMGIRLRYNVEPK